MNSVLFVCFYSSSESAIMGAVMLKRRLEKTLKATRSQLMEIEESERAERNQRFVGRYFRYQNCYSCPAKSSDYWCMYFRVVGLTNGGLSLQKFQTDKDGNLRVEPNDYWHEMLDGCNEITQQQYEKAFSKAMEAASVVVS